ncbi:MAG: right-handed parallel beta-helix repeat-containing protein, partial [Myxococcota bacterium]
MRERGTAQRVVCGVLVLGAALLLGPSAGTQSSSSPPDFRIAFIGDQGDGADADAVLSLIASEQTDAVLHSGDFDYSDDPLGWDTRITNHLGPDFPYFASVGNHDEREFYGAGGYQEFLEARMNRLGIAWQGDLGVQSSFEYAGIFFVLTAPDSFGEGDGYHDLYIRDRLAADDSVWRLSSFHKNMNAMQVGGKNDSTGWGVYEESRRGGAIIATAHEHVYARTHLLSNTETQTVASFDDTLVLSRDDPASPEDEGRSFVFVSGIAGSSIRDQERCLPETPPYGCQGEWASIYANQQGARPGALFGVFNYQGNPDLAYFYFKDIDENVVDSFFVESRLAPAGPPPVAANDGPYFVAAGETLSRDAPGVLANDGASLTAILEDDVRSGTLSLAPDGSFTYTHDGSATTSDDFRYRASNGVRESNLATASIAVLPAQGATLEVPGDFSSIQAAHDAAQSGDLILVAPGSYRENLTLTTAVTLGSWFVTTGDPAYVDTTILDGDGGAAVIKIPASAEEGIAIVGLTIQNADDGIFPKARFDLIRNRIRFTTDGADYEAGSGGICRYNVFENNSDDGVDLDGAVDIVVEFNTMRNNGGDGMEIRLQPYTGPTLDYIIRSNLIHGNQEDGIQLIDYDTVSDRRFEISRNVIHDNVQAGLGMMSGANTVENFEGASIPEPIHVISNTFLGNDHGMTGGDNAVVLNNLFVGHPAIALKNVDGDSLAAFNLFHDNGTDISGSNLDALTTLFGDPLLDESLKPSQASPAIDAGTDFFVWQGVTVLDLDPSEYLGAAPDLGAFELVPGTAVAPRAPTPVEPPDGAVDVSLTPTLRWVGTADFYQLQLATSGDFTTGSIVHDVVTSDASVEHALSSGVLSSATTYFWRVRGSNAGGMGAWSSTWTFHTQAAT